MLRGFLSVAFAAFLLLIVLGYWKAVGGTPERAMWDVALIGVISLLYLSFTGFSAVRHSIGKGARALYIGLVFSFLPLLVAVYSIAVWQYSPDGLTTFQVIAVLFGGLAALLDVMLFSWLSFRHLKG
ncbi:MAG: hypothetical protein AB7O43_16105 [Hyphomicrobiaceae bacterium]